MDLTLNSALHVINSVHNELGPYLIPAGWGTSKIIQTHPDYSKYIFLYATDFGGNLDIMFTQNITNEIYSVAQEIKFLNTDKDDAYPTLNAHSSAIYFCSNRDADFDIYMANLNVNRDLLSELSDTADLKIIAKDATLSSPYDDKCPFILGNLMVFASNRPGGFGGFDLYYSTYVNGKWSAPVNFGDKINTSSDEYRPIVKTFYDQFTNDFMVFSSDRPGGIGGYDLYYVGINKMTE
jgi:Tol biopolymer transport system component